ncbi:MAG: InlB B-repeat-containing protein [Bacilli bacterium]|nr:InlB B-repeat-containing protein [Bacilli bacterium]
MSFFRKFSVLTAFLAMAFGVGATATANTKSPAEIKAAVGSYSTDASTYYNGITATSGTSLLGQLHDLMCTTHKKYTTYDDCKNSTYVYAMEPGTSSYYVTDFYTQENIAAAWGSGDVGTWNREHVWCQSQSIDENTDNQLWGTTYGGSDLHHIRPVETTLNTARNNNRYGVLSNLGLSNRDSHKAYSKDTSKQILYHGGYVSASNDVFEPLDSVKGDVARIVMYVYMHYSSHSYIGGTTDGSLTNGSTTGKLSITNIVHTSANTEEEAFKMLLSWNTADPVSSAETYRNNQAAIYQGNRNPFIDNSSYANAIWGNGSVDPGSSSSATSSEESSSSSEESSSSSSSSSEDSGDSIVVEGVIATIAEENEWVSGEIYTPFNLDANVSVSTTGTGNNGKYYSSGDNWRIYKSGDGNVIISVPSAYYIKSISLVFVIGSYGTLLDPSLNTMSSGNPYQISGKTTTSVTFTVSNSSGNGGNIRISTISVTYAPLTYTVTYNSNGAGSGQVPVDSTKYVTGASATVLGNTGSMAKSGYNFAGWNTANDGSGTPYSAGSSITMNADVTLYAVWEVITHTLNYDGNGATSGSAPTDSNEYDEGTNATVLGNTGNLAKSGYAFNGWNTANDGSGTSYSAGDYITMNSDITLFAVWEVITHTLTYNANGATSGSAPTDSNEYNEGTNATVLGNTGNLAKTGYTFNGWNTSNDGNGTSYEEDDSILMNSDITLYALWEAQSGGDVTIGKTIATIATENSWANSTAYTSFTLDSVVTISGESGGNNCKYYSNGEDWRHYQTDSGKVTVSVKDGYHLESITFTFSVAKTGALLDANLNSVTSGTAISISGSSTTSASFTVGNSGSANNGQVRITAISVTYASNSTPSSSSEETSSSSSESSISSSDSSISSGESSSSISAEGTYKLVTSMEEIMVGAKVVIASTYTKGGTTYTQVCKDYASGNYYNYVSGSLSDNILTPAAGYGVFTLGYVSGENNGYTLKDSNEKYLSSPSTSNNNMKGVSTLDSNCYWNIDLNSDNPLNNVVNKTKSVIKFNSDSGTERFSCYGENSDCPGIQLYCDVPSIVSAFVNNYLYMSSTASNQCETYFPLAKTKLLALGSTYINEFRNNGDFSEAKARYEAWAINQGENPYDEGALSLYHNDMISLDDSRTLFIVAVVAITSTFVGGMMLAHRRKKGN